MDGNEKDGSPLIDLEEDDSLDSLDSLDLAVDVVDVVDEVDRDESRSPLCDAWF
jgi:hypothetical protein